MKKNLLIVILVGGTLLVGYLLGSFLSGSAGNTSLKSGGGKIDELLNLVSNKYVDTVNVEKMSDAVLSDLVQKLDPHSVYIPASDFEDVNSELEGKFSGIGVQFNIQNDTVMIISVISAGPSEKAGLIAGDRIVQVNDTNFTGKTVSNEKVMKKLRGKLGTKVKLTVKRNGTKELLKYTITRGEIPVNSVDVSYMLAPNVGYIKVSKFAATTYKEFLNAIASLRSQGAQKYVIDLRQNSGGFMDQAIEMINEFLEEGRLIVYSQGNNYPKQEARANGKGSCINNPLVVLTDEFSASASEIFSGAIQDNDRGLVVGRRTFGKGLVQQQIPFSDGSAVRLTVARYYTPSGRCIQKPYEKGKIDDYEMDILKRYKRGELDSKDSIKQIDSLKYKTVAGRIVYGGGGIMPDVFVPRDTSFSTPFLNKVINAGYIYQFAFKYADQNRNTLNTYKTWQQMETYLDKQNLVESFVLYAASKGVKPMGDITKSKKYLLQEIKAFIVRDIMGDKGFYPIINKDDKTLNAALKCLTSLKTNAK